MLGRAHKVTREPMLKSFARAVPALMAYVDRDLIYRFANDAYRVWRGLAPDQVVGRSFREVVGEQSYPYLMPKAQAALNGEKISYEDELFDGEHRRFVHGTYTPDRQADGTVSGFFILVTDVTDRHELEERIRRSEQQFNDAFRHAAIGMALVGLDGHWLRVNPALAAMLGYEEEEFLGLTFQDFTHRDDLTADLALVQELIDGKRSTYQMEKRYFRKDGAIVYAILAVSLVRDADGQPLHFVSQIQDITARRAAEERLFQENELLKITLHSIGDGVITTDRESRVTGMNPAAERLTGWPSGEAAGMPMGEVFRIAHADGEPIADPVNGAIRSGVVTFLDRDAILHRRNGGTIPVSDSVAPIRNRSGDVVGGVLVFQDASAERARERHLLTQAQTDPLTGLLNRAGFDHKLREMMGKAQRQGVELALLFCDLDGFKPINDRYGHSVGDKVLKEVAARLLRSTRHGDIVSRWAGDEFVIILLYDEAETLDHLSHRLLKAVHRPIAISDPAALIRVGMSIGIACAQEVEWNRRALLNRADAALYAVKAMGGNAARLG